MDFSCVDLGPIAEPIEEELEVLRCVRLQIQDERRASEPQGVILQRGSECEEKE